MLDKALGLVHMNVAKFFLSRINKSKFFIQYLVLLSDFLFEVPPQMGSPEEKRGEN